jgi:hypothetical protein
VRIAPETNHTTEKRPRFLGECRFPYPGPSTLSEKIGYCGLNESYPSNDPHVGFMDSDDHWSYLLILKPMAI